MLQPVGTGVAPKREPMSPTKASEQQTDSTAPFAFLTHTQSAQALGVQPLPSSSTGTATTESRTPLTTHTSFTASQLPYLRQLLATLKPHLATAALPKNTSGKAGEKDELTRERKAYVESQSKRILERRGVDTKDGVEGVWDGNKVRSDEVRGLEQLVESISKGGRKEDHAGAGHGENDGEAMDTS